MGAYGGGMEKCVRVCFVVSLTERMGENDHLHISQTVHRPTSEIGIIYSNHQSNTNLVAV